MSGSGLVAFSWVDQTPRQLALSPLSLSAKVKWVSIVVWVDKTGRSSSSSPSRQARSITIIPAPTAFHPTPLSQLFYTTSTAAMFCIFVDFLSVMND